MAQSSLIQGASAFLLFFFVATAGTTYSQSSKAVGHRTDTPSQIPSHEPSSSPTKLSSLNPTQEQTEKPSDEPTERPTETPSNEPSGAPTKMPTTRSPDAPPTGEPSLPPSQAPSRVAYNAEERALSCYTYNMTNNNSALVKVSLLPCRPDIDAYCLTYGTHPSSGGMVVGTCSPSNCLPILRTVQHAIFCNACQETACNAPINISGSGGIRCGSFASVVAMTAKSIIISLMLSRFLF